MFCRCQSSNIEWQFKCAFDTKDKYSAECKEVDVNGWYMFDFLILPVGNMLLNWAQLKSIQALFYVSRSMKQRNYEYTLLVKYPRLQELYSIFLKVRKIRLYFIS